MTSDTAAPRRASVPGIGLNLPTWPLRDRSYMGWPQMRSLALEAEGMGVDTLWAPDHLQRDMPDGSRVGFWECWTIVTALAEATSRVEIGPFVACAGFRNPALLAKMALTLDEVSGGRLVLGLGSGVPERDSSWKAFGFDAGRPVARYDEAAQVVARLLREPRLTFEGEFFRTEDAEILPRGPLADAPPLWVAGLGDRTAQVAARWGDAINVNKSLAGSADMDEILAIRDRACAAVGRDPSTLTVTGFTRLVLEADGTALPAPGCLSGPPDEVAAAVRSFAARGLAHITFYLGTPDDPSRLPALTHETLARFGPVLEAIRAG